MTALCLVAPTLFPLLTTNPLSFFVMPGQNLICKDAIVDGLDIHIYFIHPKQTEFCLCPIFHKNKIKLSPLLIKK